MREVGWLAVEVCGFHEDIKEQIQEHEERIRMLEITNTRLAERIDNLCKEISSLTSWIKGLVIAFLTTLSGFFIWYIQSLPR